ncbi:hypothetical protein M9Y10_023873 [Tritrichomonas musculus]|uniref:Translation elongation factor EF1B beta/delta subunit guanine nucleotide exchange domain-containing protein n=1 Tax=Tritrichomonas musculus TaxID=1915356 RepID=A0ABR2KWE1_9EUKA
MKALYENYPILIDICPVDIDVDLDKLEAKIRDKKFDGIQWGRSQRQERFHNFFILQFKVIVANDKVDLDDFLELLEEDEEISKVEIEAGGVKLI